MPAYLSRNQSFIHWPIVAGAGIGATIFVVLLVFSTWLGTRGVPFSAEENQELAKGEISGEDPVGLMKAAPPAKETAKQSIPPAQKIAEVLVNPSGREAALEQPEPAKAGVEAFVFQEEPIVFPEGPGGKAPPPENCESFGTQVNFVAQPLEAAQLAKKSNKLLFLLHLSGNFEDPQFT